MGRQGDGRCLNLTQCQIFCDNIKYVNILNRGVISLLGIVKPQILNQNQNQQQYSDEAKPV
jgi:hypothetical protein